MSCRNSPFSRLLCVLLAFVWPECIYAQSTNAVEKLFWYDWGIQDSPFVAASALSKITVENMNYCYNLIDLLNGYYTTSPPELGSENWLTAQNNYYFFKLNLASGQKLILDRVVFQSQTYLDSPNEYDVRCSVTNLATRSISGGWQPIPLFARGITTNITANNGGVPLTELKGKITFEIHGRGATSSFGNWYISDLAVYGSIQDDAPSPVVVTAPAIAPGSLKMSSQDFSWLFTNQASLQYAIEASDNLAEWRVVETLTGAGQPIVFTDKSAPGVAQRFYRIRVIP